MIIENCCLLLRSLTLETDRLKRLEDDLRKREVTVSNTEVHVDQEVQIKLNKYNLKNTKYFSL